MKMFRRGFLKSIIGAVAASPFLALTDDDPWQRIVDSRFRMLYKLRDGHIQAPGIAKIVYTGYGYRFHIEDLNCTQSMEMVGAKLFDFNGEMISDKDFNTPINTCDGDTFKLVYNIDFDVKIAATLDEVIEAVKKKNRHISNVVDSHLFKPIQRTSLVGSNTG